MGYVQPIAAQEADVAHFVTYIEVVPGQTQAALDLLEAYAADSRAVDGNRQFQALQRIGRPNHFAILETWADADARASHAGSAEAERFRASLTRLLYSPPDERRHYNLLTAASRSAASNGIYVLTHVDVSPPGTDQTVEHLRKLAAASRNEDGNLRFDVLVSDRANHMTLVEVWASAAARERHLSSPHAKAFRKDLAPLLGALYDERLYRAL